MEPTQTPVPSRPGNPGRKSGFTLVELLVVIVIIAVLAAVAIFSMRGIRQKSYKVKALNSIRQVGSATVAYSAENYGDIPSVLYSGDARLTGGWVTKTFWGRLAPYIFEGVSVADNKASVTQMKQALNSIFATTNCVEMPDTFLKGVQIYQDTSGLPVPFAFNSYTQGWMKYPKTSTFDVSQTIHFTYGFSNFNESARSEYTPLPDVGNARIPGIHYFPDKTGVFVFLDGHAEVLSPPIPKRRLTSAP